MCCAKLSSGSGEVNEKRFYQNQKNGPSREGPICLGSLWLGESIVEFDLRRRSTNLVLISGAALRHLCPARAALLGGGLLVRVRGCTHSRTRWRRRRRRHSVGR